MNFTFEGNYKPKRNINLGGVKVNEDRKSLMAKAQSERKARERERLRIKSATKIQSFYRGCREAAIIRDRERTAFTQLVTLAKETTDTAIALDLIIRCARKLLLFYRSPMTNMNDDKLVKEFFKLLLSCAAESNFMMLAQLFVNRDADALDLQIWQIMLLIRKVLVPFITVYSREKMYTDTTIAVQLLSAIFNPSTYECIRSIDTAFPAHETYMRILTYCLMKAETLYALNIFFSNLSSDIDPADIDPAVQVLLSVIQCKPPYDYPQSTIQRLQADAQQKHDSIRSNLMFIESSEESAPLRLSREIIVELFTVNILSIHFLFDWVSTATMPTFAVELPFTDVLNFIIKIYEGNNWQSRFDPTTVTGLLINITYLGSFEGNKQLDNTLIAAIDSDSDSENEAMQLVEPSKELRSDSLIRERLEALYNSEKLNNLVHRFMRIARSTDQEPMKIVGPMTNLLNTLMIRFSGKNDSILNILLYHRWSSSSHEMTGTYLTQILWLSWYSAMAENWSTLYLLCEMYTRLLLTIGDDEFFGKSNSNNQLELDQVISLSRHLKNISFILFWRASMFKLDNMLGLTGITIRQLRTTVTNLLQQIHMRDSRRAFCPKDHWLIDGLDTEGFASEAIAEEFSLEQDHPERARGRQPSKSELANISPRLGLLNNIPFVIPFEHRVEIFRKFVENNRRHEEVDSTFFPRATVTIRRDHLFEDSFNHLYKLGAGLKRKISITFMDEFGMHEAGIDGGGVFKEFLTCFGHEAFDTNYGLFVATADQLLYPNPSPYATEGAQLAYFEFIGLMIGKALYEGILLDVAFAEFFLKKCLEKVNYLDDLPSLDPELYKGLIAVKNFPGNVEDLCLDFTLTENG
ncbi:hypothetical protein EC973_002218 [Apophysomyces ossiformis]|uniref:HECT-type E3 ubiquitin transferase n=1 Tax=Apophysomyces ossiformis TaxID=679940 RepID=A0A8H7BWC2_9FUNG|nr:hypothetical protein EC973_002218 [Apophysomyces ossiformis]